MATFIYDLVGSLDEQWEEIDLLIDKAEAEQANEKLYNALCRSALVLMVAQFEAFIKSCVKAVIADVNMFASFKDLPSSMKRTFSQSLIKAENETQEKNKDLNQRVTKLIEIFDTLDTKIDANVFLVMNDFGNNQKNPSPAIIDKVCCNFGLKNFFSILEGSKLDVVFTDNRTEVEEVRQKIIVHVMDRIENYPYNIDPTLLDLQITSERSPKERTLWQTFLDQVLSQRHGVAHGSSTENNLGFSEIIDCKNKLQILQYSFVLLLCRNCVQVTTESPPL